MSHNLLIGIVIGLVLAVGYLAYTQFSSPQAPSIPSDNSGAPTTTPTPTFTPQAGGQTMRIKIALLDTTGTGAGKQRGCDTVNMAVRTVPRTSAVLDAALKALFAEPGGAQPDAAYNFIARTRDTLKFDRVTITNGTANIYLTGQLSGLGGICDDPRTAIQLEETALQFPTVQKVQFYLNGTATNLAPSQQ